MSLPEYSWFEMRAELRAEGGFVSIECQECWRPFDSDGPRLCESCRLHVSTVGLSYEDEHGAGDADQLDWDDLMQREPNFPIDPGSIEYRKEDEFIPREGNAP